MVQSLPVAAPRFGGQVVVTACLTIFALSQGLIYPLLALALRARGHDEAAIGLSAATTALGVLLTGLFLTPLVRRCGARPTVLVATLAAVLLWLGFPLFDDYVAWTAMRLALGISAGVAYVVGELWLNQVVRPEARGRAIGIYGAILSAGFACGPLILSVTGIEGWLPYLVGAAGCLVTVLMVYALGRDLPEAPPPAPAGSRGVWRELWRLLAVVGGVAFFDQAALSLLPVYGAGRGLDESAAALLAGVMVVGNIVLQFPLGLLADRIGPARVMTIACLCAGAIALLLPATVAVSWSAWPLLFLWGGLGFGVYMLSLAELGRRFSDERLLAGSAAYAVVWGLGGLAGPAGAGAAMEWGGPDWLFWLSAGLLGGLGCLMLAGRRD